MDYSSFEQLLKNHNTTVYRVSKETGIAASTFSDWKNGRSSPKAEKLMKIAAFFGVSLDELLGTPLAALTHPRAPVVCPSLARSARAVPSSRTRRCWATNTLTWTTQTSIFTSRCRATV